MLVAISQRHSNEHGGGDMLEANYVHYFSAFGATLIPIPNNAANVEKYFQELPIDRVILSGGGDIQPVLYGGTPAATGNYSPERENTEKVMLDIAVARDIPILGICRGMEVLNIYFGGRIQSTASVEAGLEHDETRHNVAISNGLITKSLGAETFEVNSYHRMTIVESQLSPRLAAFAIAPDSTIEGFYSPEHAAAGIIWHPEREHKPHSLNEFLVDAFLSRKLFWQKRSRSEK